MTPGQHVTPNVRLLRPLGAGGMGAVWVAEHLSLKTDVVVKFMLHGAENSQSARARFSREAAAAALVKSPHVVQMLDHGVTDEGIPFIVMEHLEGDDLSKHIEARGKLEPREVVDIVHQVAKALTGVHAAGLLHRDIKPENIFLCEHDGEEERFAKLLDFGIVKEHQSEDGSASGDTKTGQVVGTPFYMSPEQVTAQRELDFGTDLWALGVVVFEALTGRRPFDGPSFGALAVAIATGPIPVPTTFNPELPASVDAWFKRACSRDAAARFTSARQMSDALRACFDASHNLSPTSAAHGDSGSRARLPDGGSGPRAVSPALELAETLATDEPPPLARSQPDRAAEALSADRGDASRDGPSRPWLVYAVVGLLALGVAGFVGARFGRREAAANDGRGVASPSILPPPATQVASAPDPSVDVPEPLPTAAVSSPTPSASASSEPAPPPATTARPRVPPRTVTAPPKPPPSSPPVTATPAPTPTPTPSKAPAPRPTGDIDLR